jgi:hypothetical protein
VAALLALVAVIAIGAIAAATTSGDDGDDTPGGGGAEVDADDVIGVVEHGMTAIPRGRGELVIYGIVVRNRTDEVARDVALEVEVLDGATAIETRSTGGAELTAPVLMPGEEFGFGNTVQHYEAGHATDLRIDVAVGGLDAPEPHGETTVENLTSDEESSLPDRREIIAEFGLDSTYDTSAAAVFVVCRDQGYRIVGGAAASRVGRYDGTGPHRFRWTDHLWPQDLGHRVAVYVAPTPPGG